MGRVGVVVAAFVLGVAIGLLNNTISNWVWRLGGRDGTDRARPGLTWPSLLALQSAARIALSLVSLYIAYSASQGDTGVVLANLAGLFLTRYLMLWRLSRTDAGKGPG